MGQWFVGEIYLEMENLTFQRPQSVWNVGIVEQWNV